MIAIKELNEWSLLHNKTIKPFNKPKNKGRTGFSMTLEPRIR